MGSWASRVNSICKGPEVGKIVLFFDQLVKDPWNKPWRAKKSQLSKAGASF